MAQPKLFLFCIGGTGARVLKALAFLLAAGTDIQASKIIPIIIDPDRDNGDVNRTIEILNKYQAVRSKLEFQKNSFFRTDIQTLGSLQAISGDTSAVTAAQGFKFSIDGAREGSFRDFLAYDQLDPLNKALVGALYSDKNLNAELKVGFKGNPHMGSVVLNQFKNANDFKYFASRFDKDDRIFIVSSIFGGTGAAGFPLLVKNIREAANNIPNHDNLKESAMGAITVLPYFGVSPDANSSIDKGTFAAKTKAALSYYERNLTGENNKSLNALYYIADSVTNDFKASDGADTQRNNAHYVEMLAALSVIDFMDIPADKLKTSGGQAENPVYKEYGLINADNVMSFKNLGKRSRDRVLKPLTQFAYACKYWNEHLDRAIDKIAAFRIDYNRAFLSNDFFDTDLTQFSRRYFEWLNEMKNNIRSFAPFNLDVSGENLHNLVNGIEQTRTGAIFKSAEWNYNDYDDKLNEVDMRMVQMDPNAKFMALFSQATAAIYEWKLAKQISL